MKKSLIPSSRDFGDSTLFFSGISLKILLSYRGPTEDQQDWNPPQNSIIMAIRVGDSVKLTHQRLEAVVDTLDCMC